MTSSLGPLTTLGTQVQASLANIASHGIALESQLSLLLPCTYPPYLRFFTHPQIKPFGGVQLVEAAYLLLPVTTIFVLLLSLVSDPIVRGRITWIGIGTRAVVILGVSWGMIVFVSKTWVVLKPRGGMEILTEV
jgi:hypothetical protein